MFDNIGGKIKELAKVIFAFGVFASVAVAILCFVNSNGEGLFMGIGFVTLFLGPVLSWVGCFFTYGFGELIDNTQTIAERLKEIPILQPEQQTESLISQKAKIEIETDMEDSLCNEPINVPDSDNKTEPVSEKDTKSNVDTVRIEKLKQLRMKNLISETEFQILSHKGE